ncbi:MAG TPA: hypothetical protein VFR67_28895 [Pilimelia sp.]|nr:hypothetical protein [Pilimelia sp.]
MRSANRVVPVEHLIAGLWGDEPPQDARALVQGLCRPATPRDVRYGRRAESLVTRAPRYLLRIGPDELDLDRFEELTATARRLA